MEGRELNRLAVTATLHCLAGCATGEVIGNVIGSSLGWSLMMTEILAIGLAFIFGYGFTMLTLLRHGIGVRRTVRLALASDTVSITVMEVVDTIIVVSIPGAVAAGPGSALFWGSLTAALAVAFVCAVPANRYLIARGKGHAVIHGQH